MPLYAFLLSKSLEVFYNTGQLLLRMHADSALVDAQQADTMAVWEGSPPCVALRLASRCFKHCVEQPNSSSDDALSLLTPAFMISAAASSKILFAHLRLADCLLLLHHCSTVVRQRCSDLHPLLQSAYDVATNEREPLPESDVVSPTPSSSSSPSDDPYDLRHAVSHLKRALVMLHERQQQQGLQQAATTATPFSAAAAAAAAAALSSLMHATTLQLASVLLTLRDASHALQVLSSLPPPSPQPSPPSFASSTSKSAAPSSAASAAASAAAAAVGGAPGLDPEQRLHADLYAVEAHLLLQNPEDAMRALCASRNHCVRRCVLQCSSQLTTSVTATVGSVAPSAADSHDLSGDDAVVNVPLSLHVYSTLAFLFLAQQLPDRAARCVQLGLALAPSHPPLLQLALLQSMRADTQPPHNMHALWLLKRQTPAAAPEPPPVVTCT